MPDEVNSEPVRFPCLIDVDLRQSRRGLECQLSANLGGRSVLQRTIEAVRRCQRLERPLLLVRSDQQDAVAELVDRSAVDWFIHDHNDIPARGRLRRARKWGKEGWRGGIDDAFFVCEDGNAAAIEEALRQQRWDSAMVVPASAPFLDATLLDAMAVAFMKGSPDRQLMLSTAPPGLAADIVRHAATRLCVAGQQSIGSLIRFRPDEAIVDLETQQLIFRCEEDISKFRGRFTIDSKVDLARATLLWERYAAKTLAPGVTTWPFLFAAWDEVSVQSEGPTPEELILELGSDRGGFRAPRTEWSGHDRMPDSVFDEVLAACRQRDDTLLTFGGGFHDPLHDSSLAERIRRAREQGAYGISIETHGAGLTAEGAAALVEADVDVICFDLTAPTAELAHAIAPHASGYEERVAGLEAMLAARDEVDLVPLVVVSMQFEQRTMGTWEQLFDRFHGRVDRVLMRGVESPEGRIPDESVGAFAPPTRFPCTRLWSQMRCEHNGRVPLCSRDPQHGYALGDLQTESVAEIWQGEPMQRARAAHRASQWKQIQNCGPCRSWFRFD